MNTNLNEYKFQEVWSAHSPREPVCLPKYLRICMHLQTNIDICTYIQVTFAKEPYKRDDIGKSLLNMHLQTNIYICTYIYGVATMSRLLKIIGLFCRISSLSQGSFVKGTYDFKEPTSRSHPIYRRLFQISSLLQGSFAKETYNFKEPTSRSHPIFRRLFPISSLLQGSFAKVTYNFKEPTSRSHPICVCIRTLHVPVFLKADFEVLGLFCKRAL